MTNFNEITKNVRKEYSSIKDDACECGGKFQSHGQALCYSEKEKAMVDLIDCKCDKCGKEKSFSFPVKSDYGQAMAGFFQILANLKAKGLDMYSGHTVLEGSSRDDKDKWKEEFTLKLQCYKCDNLFEYNYPKQAGRVACPKCDAS